MQGFRRLCSDTITKDESGIERGYYLSKKPHTSFFNTIEETRTKLEGWLRFNRGNALEGAVYQFSSLLKRFGTVSEYYDERFLTFITTVGDEETIRLICLDASEILSKALSKAHASILFSATLTPLDYFSDVLGGGKGAVRVSLPSPFDPSKLCIVGVTSISTRYDDRGNSYKKLVSYIAASVSGKRGNYIVYFPSYEYMEKVLNCFKEKYPSIETVVQEKGMTASAKESFLNAFAEDNKLRIGFCVLGGSFSEGVDLPGKQLIGAIIIGTGIPGISNERNILREYYDHTRENGYEYAYTYPGMNRVLQAAGRVIRREEDTGIVVLIDDRYATEQYKVLYPDHWRTIKYAGSASELAEIINSFWKNKSY
jgi:Rad3-related DNA helicase